MDTTDCPFCKIIRGEAPASVVAENKNLISFMTLRPTRPGDCLVIPKQHIDHFTDIPDEMATALMVMAQAIGRVMRNAFQCQRVGMVVHGFGVPHAHLVIVPQHGPYDIAPVDVSGDGVTLRTPPALSRTILDEHARRLAMGLQRIG